MYSKELEQLIKSVIADGVITDKERVVLHKKASAEGVDADEIDVYVDGLVAQMKSVPSQDEKKKQRKCPHCGEILRATDIVCPNCGNEISSEQVHSSVQKLFDLIQKEDNRYAKEKTGGASSEIQKKHEENIRSIIEQFPIPNDSEAMLEFLTLGISQIKNVNLKNRTIAMGIMAGICTIITIIALLFIDKEDREVVIGMAWIMLFIIPAPFVLFIGGDSRSEAWRTKCKQVVTKAKFAFANDPKRLAMFTQYEGLLKRYHWK